MAEAKKRYTHTCHRCSYTWMSSLEHPVRCTNCKSPYWHKARMRKKMKAYA